MGYRRLIGRTPVEKRGEAMLSPHWESILSFLSLLAVAGGGLFLVKYIKKKSFSCKTIILQLAIGILVGFVVLALIVFVIFLII